MPADEKFPKRIYVMRQDGGDDDPYLTVFESTEDFGTIEETAAIAVYELLEVGEVEVTRIYEGPETGAKRTSKSHRKER